MQTQNHNHIAAPVEAPDNSMHEATHDRAVEILAEVVLDELVSNPHRRGEAMLTLEDAEYDAINAAYDYGPQAHWLATQTALRRALRAEAVAEAERRVKALGREDLRDWIEEGKEVTK